MSQQDCVFCQIVRGEAPAAIVLDEGPVLAFMALHQRNPGHLLVIPKAHVPTLYELDEALAGPLFGAVVRLTRLVKAVFQPDGVTVRQHNERAGGQEIDHVHVHVIPRRADEIAASPRPPRPAAQPRAALEEQAARLRAAIASRGLAR